MTSNVNVHRASKGLRLAVVLGSLAVGEIGAQRAVALPPGTQPKVPVVVPVGAPPIGVVVSGTPAQARVAWQPTPGASGYSVLRWKQADPNCCRAQSPAIPASTTSWDDLVQWSGTWVYRVTALYPDGAQGFVDVSYLYPEPQIPAGFKAEQTGEGIVALSWQPVPNASYYVVAGPPANQSMQVKGTNVTVTGVPTGNTSWQLGSIYDPDGIHRAGSTLTSTSLNVVRRSGRYRLLVEEMRVDQQTNDPNNDGHGDEVYVSAYVQTLDRRTGTLLQAATLRSAIHGDVTYWPPPARAVMGTASGYGGLKTGDVMPVLSQAYVGGTFGVFVLWEGLLTDGVDEVLVAPALWESDDQIDAYQRWGPAMQQAIPTLIQHPTVVAEAAGAGLNAVLVREFDLSIAESRMDRPLGSRLAWQPLGGDRIWMRQWVVVLTREKIEGSLSSPNSFGGLQSGVIPVVLTDGGAPVLGLGGSYTIYLRVERLP